MSVSAASPGTGAQALDGSGSDCGRVALAGGVELAGEFVGSGYREAPRLVYRADGQVIRLPELLYLVVEALDHATDTQHDAADLDQVAASVSRALTRQITPDQIRYLCDHKLAPLGVTTYSDGSAPRLTRTTPFLALRVRIPVLPATFTWHVAGAFRWLFYPAVMIAALLVTLGAEVWALATQHVAYALTATLASPTGIIVLLALALASAAFHEAGHAAACRHGGVAPGVMGCGIYLVWPAFYTDITATYRLGRGGRLRADLGGVYFNAVFALALIAGYAGTGYQPLLAAVLATNLEIVEQLLPTLRFDGYYIIADLVGIPDLFRYIRPILARSVLRRRADARLTELKRWPQRIITAWVLCIVPVLLIELGYILISLPRLIRTDIDNLRRILSGAFGASHPVWGWAAATIQIVVMLLPMAGASLIVIGVLRGVWHGVARRHRHQNPNSRRRGVVVAIGGLLVAALVWLGNPIQTARLPGRHADPQALPPISTLTAPPSHSTAGPHLAGDSTGTTARAHEPMPAPSRRAGLPRTPGTTASTRSGSSPAQQAAPRPHRAPSAERASADRHRTSTSTQQPPADSGTRPSRTQTSSTTTSSTTTSSTSTSSTPTSRTTTSGTPTTSSGLEVSGQPSAPASPAAPARPSAPAQPAALDQPSAPTQPSAAAQPTAPDQPSTVASILSLPSIVLRRVGSHL